VWYQLGGFNNKTRQIYMSRIMEEPMQQMEARIQYLIEQAKLNATAGSLSLDIPEAAPIVESNSTNSTNST
jgi:hypothetical protein